MIHSSKDSVESRKTHVFQIKTAQFSSSCRSCVRDSRGGEDWAFLYNMMTYSEKLKSPLWQKRRLEVMERDDWQCRLCFDKGATLAVHHKRYADTRNPWDSDKNDLVTLCQDCHTAMHDGTLERTAPMVDSFYKAVTDCRLSNNSKSLIRNIETASNRFLSACDEMEGAITPLRARLYNMIEREASL